MADAETFTCSGCGGTFARAWTEEEAIAEFHQLHPGEPFDRENMVVLCDTCHEQFLKWLEPQ